MRSGKVSRKAAALDRARGAAAKAESVLRAAELAVRKPALALIRERYVPIFGLPIDVAGINFRAPPKVYLTEVLRRQTLQLETRSDEDLVTIWLRFSKFISGVRPAERARRDLDFLDALASEWQRRKVSADGEEAYFRWPTTLISEVSGHSEVDGQWPSSGMLDALDYHVGKTRGQATATRRHILSYIFEERLPLVYDTSYTAMWDRPATARRLQKMAETIAALVRNAKRNSSRDYSQAILEWEDDLLFLWSTYYRGKFGFGWPVT